MKDQILKILNDNSHMVDVSGTKFPHISEDVFEKIAGEIDALKSETSAQCSNIIKSIFPISTFFKHIGYRATISPYVDVAIRRIYRNGFKITKPKTSLV